MYTIAILNIALLLIYLLNRFLKQFIELRKFKRKIKKSNCEKVQILMNTIKALKREVTLSFKNENCFKEILWLVNFH